MVKRICPKCGVPNLEFSQAKEDIQWPCHHCGTELEPELNKRLGEPEPNKRTVTMKESLMHFPVIGQVLESGHKVLANYRNRFILACSENPKNPQPYVVWYLDQEGDPYGGCYFKEAVRAEVCFAECCFTWFDREDFIRKATSKSTENKEYEDLCICPL